MEGIFDKSFFLFDPWFEKDNFKDLTSEIDKFNFQEKKNRLKVYQFFFKSKKKFKFEYIFRTPTIENLKKYQFKKKYQGLMYLINLINSKINLNIGTCLFFLILKFF